MMLTSLTEPVSKKLHILKSVFGYASFRPLQEECIDAVLRGQDTLLLMPTGGGKSLCYQIPALMMEGLTVVVSPLISLMKDQVSQLKSAGVEAEVLNSSLSTDEYSRNMSRVSRGTTKMLFLAPETLFKDEVLGMLQGVDVECLTVDEAHCISEWGHDFRPEYRLLKDIRSLFPKTVCLAVTATATKQVRTDIINNLQLRSPLQLTASFDRHNLFYEIVPKTDPDGQIVDFLIKNKEQSGIIYCFARKQVDDLAAYLTRKGFNALPYHAGLSDQERHRNQEAFIRDDVPIMVATIAFGMGINKPNVRFVIHHDLPKNIESYYQETGRAGRDGLNARCLLLFSVGDAAKIRYFIDQKTDPLQKKNAAFHLNSMIDFVQARGCRRIPLMAYFGEIYKEASCGHCDNCLNPPQAAIDITKQAKLFLHCVLQTNERFGAGHVLSVLRASENEKVLRYRHEQLSSFGSGKDFSIPQWQYLTAQFLSQGLLEKSDDYGVLTLTGKGQEVLKGQVTVEGYMLASKQVVSKTVRRPVEEDVEPDAALFNRLRVLRKRLADERHVPPYVIFSDRSLLDMCRRKPKTHQQFSRIYGVGDQKLKMYADDFIRAIANDVKHI